MSSPSRVYRQPSFQCPDCGRRFSSSEASARTRHLKEEHGKVLYWKCGGCHEVRESHRFVDLLSHSRSIHGDALEPWPMLLEFGGPGSDPSPKRRRGDGGSRREPRSSQGDSSLLSSSATHSGEGRRRSPRKRCQEPEPADLTRTPSLSPRRRRRSSPATAGRCTRETRPRQQPSSTRTRGSPALSLSPPATGCALPTVVGSSMPTVGESDEFSPRRSPRKCKHPRRVVRVLTSHSPSGRAAASEGAAPGRRTSRSPSPAAQESNPQPSTSSSANPARQQSASRTVTSETVSSRTLPAVEEVLSMLTLATDEERARIHSASAPDSAEVASQTDRSVFLVWGPGRTLTVRSRDTTFCTQLPEEEKEDP